MESTPGPVGSGRSPPTGPQEERDYWEDEDRIGSLLTMCYDDGVYPTEIDPGEMVVEGREVRFKLNSSLDEIKVNWLKERTVTVIFKEAARFLAKNIKDDLVRAFEDGWIIGNERLQENTRRGRLKIEDPGVASYVAKAKEVADYMKIEGQAEITLGMETYKVLFKPWMTRAEFRDLRRQEEDRILKFWVMALHVPLDDMPFIYAQIERAIGKIVMAHPTDVDPTRPGLVNARFDLEPEARPNMKDVLWVETAKGDVLEIKLACADTLKCRICRQFFHTEQDCRRGGGARSGRGIAGQSGQYHAPPQGPAASAVGGSQAPIYQGVSHQHGGGVQTRLFGGTQPQNTSAGQVGGVRGVGGGMGQIGTIPAYGSVQAAWQGGITADSLFSNGIHPALWPGLLSSQGLAPPAGQTGQMGQWNATLGPSTSAIRVNQPPPKGTQGVACLQQSFGGRLGGGPGGGRQGDGTAASSQGRSRAHTPGKQRRLSTASQIEVTPEPSGTSRLSRSGSEKSVDQEVGLVTPGQKTTRDRRLISTKGQNTDMPQYVVPLVCTTLCNTEWVITWQRGAEPWAIFGHMVQDMPTTEDIPNCLSTLYLDAFPTRLIPQVVMPRILFGPAGNKTKLYVPLINARLREAKLTELERLGLRLVPLSIFAEAKRQELSKLTVTPLMITA
ncbi:hypothetical protein CBR_g3694 [Chara braunii]|uniref:Uncharacterized protein n=1 Tax=Chara braunii TaxID=69332 RepID=A0A388KG18_CHABU|nr:hypothetical protein CBR_g3694 [Chara braunii]|eukprot:GBG68995.1 hypothetical protein CBR_g3694 [Chara braunii]